MSEGQSRSLERSDSFRHLSRLRCFKSLDIGVIEIYSSLLIVGLAGSQALPLALEGAPYGTYGIIEYCVRFASLICLCSILIHEGMQFHLDKANLAHYKHDYIEATVSAFLPWTLAAFYFAVMVTPGEDSPTGFDRWKQALMLGRFAAPTSAGVLFSMLSGAGLANTWLYKKAKVLVILEDLDTILFLIPLKFLLVGPEWEIGVVLLVLLGIMGLAYRYWDSISMSSTWPWVLLYSLGLTMLCDGLALLVSWYLGPRYHVGEIHVEVLLPAFALGMVVRSTDSEGEAERKRRPSRHALAATRQHHDTLKEALQSRSKAEAKASVLVIALFMLLVGLSMPPLFVDKPDGWNLLHGGEHHKLRLLLAEDDHMRIPYPPGDLSFGEHGVRRRSLFAEVDAVEEGHAEAGHMVELETREKEHTEESHAEDGHAGEEHAEESHAEDGHAGEEHAEESHAEDGHAGEEHAEESHAEDGHGDGHHGGGHGSSSSRVTLSAAQLANHVILMTVLMMLGKLGVVFCYKNEASWRSRLALGLGMCSRGEVGAGIIVVAASMGIEGNLLAIAILSLAVNLLLTGGFIWAIKKLLAFDLEDEIRFGGSDPRSSLERIEADMRRWSREGEADEESAEDMNTINSTTGLVVAQGLQAEMANTVRPFSGRPVSGRPTSGRIQHLDSHGMSVTVPGEGRRGEGPAGLSTTPRTPGGSKYTKLNNVLATLGGLQLPRAHPGQEPRTDYEHEPLSPTREVGIPGAAAGTPRAAEQPRERASLDQLRARAMELVNKLYDFATPRSSADRYRETGRNPVQFDPWHQVDPGSFQNDHPSASHGSSASHTSHGPSSHSPMHSPSHVSYDHMEMVPEVSPSREERSTRASEEERGGPTDGNFPWAMQKLAEPKEPGGVIVHDVNADEDVSADVLDLSRISPIRIRADVLGSER